MVVEHCNAPPGSTAEGGVRDNSFLARYGAELLRGGIAAIPGSLFRYQGELDLSLQQVWFVAAVLAHKWDAGMPHPSLKKMAARAAMSERHLHNLKNQLIEKGFLTLIPRETARGGQDTSLYDFDALFGELAQLLERDGGERDGSRAASHSYPPQVPTVNTDSAAPRKPRSARRWNAASVHAEALEKTPIKKHSQQQRDDETDELRDHDVVVALTEIGVSRTTAEALALRHPHESIWSQIDMLEQRTLHTNPAGALVRAIEQGWAPPPGWIAEEDRMRTELEEWEAERAMRDRSARWERARREPQLRAWREGVLAGRNISECVQAFWEDAREEGLRRLLGRREAEQYFGEALLALDRGSARVFFPTERQRAAASVQHPDAVSRALRLVLGVDVPVEYEHALAPSETPGLPTADVAPLPEGSVGEEYGPPERGEPMAELWARASGALGGAEGMRHYLRGSRPIGWEGNELVVQAATPYAAEWLQVRAAQNAGRTLSRLTGDELLVRFSARRDRESTGWIVAMPSASKHGDSASDRTGVSARAEPTAARLHGDVRARTASAPPDPSSRRPRNQRRPPLVALAAKELSHSAAEPHRS